MKDYRDEQGTSALGKTIFKRSIIGLIILHVLQLIL
jgi:hypothetical protein